MLGSRAAEQEAGPLPVWCHARLRQVRQGVPQKQLLPKPGAPECTCLCPGHLLGALLEVCSQKSLYEKLECLGSRGTPAASCSLVAVLTEALVGVGARSLTGASLEPHSL